MVQPRSCPMSVTKTNILSPEDSYTAIRATLEETLVRVNRGHYKTLSGQLSGTYRRPTDEVTSPDGYQKYRRICYKAFLSLKTFNDSALTCQADGDTLAMPRDAGIDAYLVSLINAAPGSDLFWFGLHDKRDEGQWEWMDGTALGTGYSRWAYGEPSNLAGDQHCAMYLKQWVDFQCERKFRFICQVATSSPDQNV
ncbi:lithostathine-1-beta-like [Branchiostoma lanceolatum]|uniref:lithostathine-1-beta-like n=1 Tax=Branchiostoma lanceolatum TaxID=7740 RepID=UPI0034557311